MNGIVKKASVVVVSLCIAVFGAGAQQRTSGHRGGSHNKESVTHSNNNGGSRAPGHQSASRPSGSSTRPAGSGVARPGGSSSTRPSAVNRPNNNHGNNHGVNRPNNNNTHRPNQGVNRPGNASNRPGAGVVHRPNAGAGHGPSATPAHRPGYGHNYRPPYVHRPPVHVHRPAPRVWHRPVPPPTWRPRRGAPVISSIFGLNFGTGLSVSLNFLLGHGYTVSSYGNNAVYLSDVNQFNYFWPEATMYYGSNGLERTEFFYSTSYPDTVRYYNLYNSMTASYGAPVNVSNVSSSLSATWFAPNQGYIRLDYSPEFSSGQLRFYTTITTGL